MTESPGTAGAVGYHGSFSTWTEALRQAKPVDSATSDAFTERRRELCHRLRRREIAFVRDGVAFDEPQYPLSLLAFILRALLEHRGELNLVDFGGFLGTTYFQARDFIAAAASVRWTVVELPQVVEVAQKELQQEGPLQFLNSLSEALAARPNVVLLSGVAQNLPDPFSAFREIRQAEASWVLFDRTVVIESPESRIAIQSVIRQGREVSWPVRLFSRSDLLREWTPDYELVAEFASYCDPAEIIDGLQIDYRGFALRRRALRAEGAGVHPTVSSSPALSMKQASP